MPVLSREDLTEKYEKYKKTQLDFQAEAPNLSADDLKTRSLAVAEEGKELLESISVFKSDAQAKGAAAQADRELEQITGQKANTGDKFAEKAEQNGLIDPRGKTFGEVVAKSPAFEKFRQLDAVKSRTATPLGGPVKIWERQQGDAQKDLFDSRLVGGNTEPSIRLGADSYTPSVRQRLALLCNYAEVSEGAEMEVVVENSRTNNATTVAEATSAATIGTGAGEVTAVAGGRKPESAIELEVKKIPFETIAHTIPISRKAARSPQEIMAHINDFALDGCDEAENLQLMTGDATSPNLHGLLNETIATFDATGQTDIDSVALALGQIWASNKRADTMFSHPDDWFTTGFLLHKDGNGQYTLANPGAGVDAVNALWDLRLVVDSAMTAGSVLIGDMRYVSFRQRMTDAVYITDSNKDHFERNILDILVEREVGVKLRDPSRFRLITNVAAN